MFPRLAPLLAAGLLPLACSSPAPGPHAAAADTLRSRLEASLEASLEALLSETLPGASAALRLPDGTVVAAAAGLADADTGQPLTPPHRLLAGSSGKALVAALVLEEAQAGRLDLDAPLQDLLSPAPAWLAQLPPGGADLTPRQLARHRSGLARYVFHPGMLAAMGAEPDRDFSVAERLEFAGDSLAATPGTAFAYADTNYIVLGGLLEALTGEAFYDRARARVLAPAGLEHTHPQDGSPIPHLAQGHLTLGRQLGLGPRALVDGRFAYNVRFEWCGGGWASTPSDLARLAAWLYGREGLEGGPLLDAVPAPELGPGVSYGLGVILRDTELGPLRFHDGFMPGYLTSMGYLPELGLAVALQFNGDNGAALGRAPSQVLVELARLVELVPRAQP